MQLNKVRIPSHSSKRSSCDQIRPVSSQPNMSSKRDTCDVPIVLQRESTKLLYEDIAKLNPFYKEYKNFWNTTPELEESSLTFSSGGSSTRSGSLQSIPSSRDSFRPLEVSSSPPLRHFRSHSGLDSSKLHVLLHDGNEHQPMYEEYDGMNTSQYAAVDHADSIKRPLTPIEEPAEYCDPSDLDPELNTRPVHPSKLPHKKLFGEDGWLGRTAEVHAVPYDRRGSQMFKGFGRKIKQQVGEIADDMVNAYPNRFSYGSLRHSKVSSNQTARVSLDPSTQAKLYSDMEVMICLSANNFLIQQHSEGRISTDSIRKINSFWGSKNRPQVMEFHFDQATQRRLILSNIRNLRFNGECSTNPVLLNTNLHNWRAIVKEMSVRTFCAPDSVIRKHMHDIHKILDMLGARVATFLDFEELQMHTLWIMNMHLKERYRSGCDTSTLSGSRNSSIRCSAESRRTCQTKC